MRKTILILIFSCVIPATILACKCNGPYPFEKEFEGAEIVFLGKVLKIDYVGLAETMNTDSIAIVRDLLPKRSKYFLESPIVLKATFQIKKLFKGINEINTITIYTGYNGASCGYRFEEDKDYIVYGHENSYLYSLLDLDRKRSTGFIKKDTYWTNHCMRTTEYIDKEIDLLTDFSKN